MNPSDREGERRHGRSTPEDEDPPPAGDPGREGGLVRALLGYWRRRGLGAAAVDRAVRAVRRRPGVLEFRERVQALRTEEEADHPGRWRRTSQLLEDRRRATMQLRALDRLQDLLDRAEDGTRDPSPRTRAAAAAALGRASQRFFTEGPATLGALRAELECLRCLWHRIAADLDEIRRPAPWALDALHYLSARSGLEAASLALPILVVLGALHTHFYYAAVGADVLPLWTWQDLINEGKHGLLPLGLSVLLVNIALWGATKATRGLGSVASAGPNAVLWLFLGCTVATASLFGYVRGSTAWHAFDAAARGSDGDAATVVARLTNEADLEGVTLVGTTDRAAVLLWRTGTPGAGAPAASPAADSRGGDRGRPSQDRAPGLWGALLEPVRRGAAAALAGLEGYGIEIEGYGRAWLELLLRLNPIRGAREPIFPDRARDAAVLDRAHVLCLGSRSRCERTRAPEDPLLPALLAVLERDEPDEAFVLPAGTRAPADGFEWIAANELDCHIPDRAELRSRAFFPFGESGMSRACARAVTRLVVDDADPCGAAGAFPWTPPPGARERIGYAVFGLASNAGAPDLNLELAESRADGAAAWLWAQGFNAVALELGEAPLLAGPGGPDPRTPAGQDQAGHRRVEFVPCLLPGEGSITGGLTWPFRRPPAPLAQAVGRRNGDVRPPPAAP